MIRLSELQAEHRAEFEQVVSEPWESNFVFAHYFETLARNDFNRYVEILPQIARGLLIPKEHVPSTLLFAFSPEGRMVGRVSIRHILNDHLLMLGGHIGYGVSPSFRNRGYATEILQHTLQFVRVRFPEIHQVLLTCDDTNLGSIKTIERNGGVLENIYKSPEMAVGKRRYWIQIPGKTAL